MQAYGGNYNMKKDIKNYLYLYLGCDIIYCEQPGKIYKLMSVDLSEDNTAPVFISDGEDEFFAEYEEVRPLFWHLSDMTEEEDAEYRTIYESNLPIVPWSCYAKHSAAIVQYLLSKHFDLFGLIEAGIAIDKTKIKHGTEQ
jgi:hypothetical protein